MILAAIVILFVSLLPGMIACARGARDAIVLGLSASLPPVAFLAAGTLLDRANAGNGGDLQGAYSSLAAWGFPVPLTIGAMAGAVALWLRERRA